MAEEIILDYVVDRPNVSILEDETDLKVLLKVNASNALRSMGGDSEPALSTNIALVLDVSSSMRVREMSALKEAARKAIDQLRPGDYLTVVAFQSVAYDIVEPTLIVDKSTIAGLKQKIDVIDQFQGGGTDMEYGIEKAADHLMNVPDRKQVRKVIVFTDGQVTGIPEECLMKAAELSMKGIGIDALGFGPEFDYKFMQRLVSYSNGFTAYVERPEDIEKVFMQRVQDITNVVAKNVHLELTFTPQIRANRGYRFSPEISYLGKIRLPGETRSISIPVGSLERDKEYAYLVTVTVPTRDAGKIRIIKAQLFYDVPALGVEQGESMQSVVVNYTDDPQATAQINGEVEKAFDEAEIGRLIEELDASMKRDETQHASMIFDILSERYREFGDDEMAAHYQALKSKFASAGELSQADMNYTRHRSTQKRDSGVQLVDASSLI